MPEPFTYAGLTPVSYTETRAADGGIIGTVEHGDTREFGTEGDEKPDGAPDWWPAPDERWIREGGELPEAWPGVSAQMYRLPEGFQERSTREAAEGSEDASAPDEPVAGGEGSDEAEAADAPAGPGTPPLEPPASLPAAEADEPPVPGSLPVVTPPDAPLAPAAPPFTATTAADGQIAQG